MVTELPEGTSDSKIQNKLLNCNIFTISTPPGYPGGSIDPGKTAEFNILGLGCDHEALELLETKNLSKTGIFEEFWLFLSGFWLLAVLKQHGRICNLKNRILWFLPDL